MAESQDPQAGANATGTIERESNTPATTPTAVVKTTTIKNENEPESASVSPDAQIQLANQDDKALARQITPPQIVMVPVGDCVENPLHVEIYGEEELNADFLNSIKEDGVMTPLLVVFYLTTEDGRTFYKIIAGHQRWRAAKEHKLPFIPVIVLEENDDLKLQQRVISSNAQRAKTNEQRAREFKKLKALEAVFAARRMKHAKDEPGQESSPARKGKAADLAAKEVGVSRPKATEMEAVVDGIDILIKAARTDEAAALRVLLNDKPHRAFKAAQEMGVIEKKQKKPKGGKSASKTATTSVESSPVNQTAETSTSAAKAGETQENEISPFESALANAKAVLAFVKSKAGKEMSAEQKDTLDNLLTKTQGQIAKL